MYYMCNNLPLSRALLLNEQAARLLKIGEGLPATFGFWGGSSGLHTKFLLSMREASVPAGVSHICVLVPTCLQLSLVHGTAWKSFRWVGSEAGYDIWSLGDVWANVHLKYYLSLKLVEYISLLTAFKEGDRWAHLETLKYSAPWRRLPLSMDGARGLDTGCSGLLPTPS